MADPIVLHRYEAVTERLRQLLDEAEMTQKELARRTDISPGHVSRSLNGDREAAYAKIYRMWVELKEEEAEGNVTAADVMEPEIEWAHPDETVEEVGERAMELAFTQFPVREDGSHIGWVTTERLAGEASDSSIRPLVHSDGFMTVRQFLDVQTVQEHLDDEYRAMLVEDDGTFLGIITPYDLVHHTLDQDGSP